MGSTHQVDAPSLAPASSSSVWSSTFGAIFGHGCCVLSLVLGAGVLALLAAAGVAFEALPPAVTP